MNGTNLLRRLIRETILSEGYYDISPNNPPVIQDVIDRWVAGDKAYDPDDSYHALYSPEELWPYREYTWNADTAGGTEVMGSDKTSYQDKWHFVPMDDEGQIVGHAQWDHMYRELQSKGWNKNKPAYVEIGKNGVAKVGEGNHRLSIAKELGIPVPVLFGFKSTVHLSGASNRG
jgi:hypothetical protein